MILEVYRVHRHGDARYRWRIVDPAKSILSFRRIIAQGRTYHETPDHARAEVDGMLDFLEAWSRERRL